MGNTLMLQEADAERIEALKKRRGARTKIEVVRLALDVLERDTERAQVVRRRNAARMVAVESRKVSHEFGRHSRLGRLD
jgi:hypothetical protein